MDNPETMADPILPLEENGAPPPGGSVWRNGDFVRLWAGQTVSVFGSLVSGTAIPFTAVLLLGASPMQMSLLNVARLLPGFLTSLVAGVWVDRLHRRPILIATDLGRAVLLLSIPIAAMLGALNMGLLYAVAFLGSILTVFFDVAYQSYLPALVHREHLTEGNSTMTASASVAEVGAFSLSGWLVQAFGGPIAVLLDSVSFVVSALFVGRIRTPEPPPPLPEERAGWRVEIAEGIRAVQTRPALRALAVSLGIHEFAFPMFSTVFLLFVTQDLGFRPGTLGVIFAVGGVSSFLGALATGRVTRRFGAGPAMIGGAILTGIGMLLVPAARDAALAGVAILVAQQLVVDPAATVYDINNVTLRQSMAPERVLGRVNAAMRFVGWGAMLGGSLLGGVLGERIGVRATLFIASLLPLVAAAWLAASPVARIRDVETTAG